MDSNPFVIGLVGKAKSGKSTVADFLSKYYGFWHCSFAQYLKEICCSLFKLDSDDLNNQDKKELIIPQYNKSPREIMQLVGQKMREIHKSIWVDYLNRDIESICDVETTQPLIVISDVRYLDEASFVKGFEEGYLIKIIREDYDNDGDWSKHTSEIEQNCIPEDAFLATIKAKSGDINSLLYQMMNIKDLLLGKSN